MSIPYFRLFGKDFLAITYDLTDAQVGKLIKILCRKSSGLDYIVPENLKKIFDLLNCNLNEDEKKYNKKCKLNQKASYARWNADAMQTQCECNPNQNQNQNQNQNHKPERENIPPLIPPSRGINRSTKIPDDFMPDETCLNVAQEEGFDNDSLNRELAKFIDYWKGNGKTKLDWQATFRNWLRNNKNYRSNSYGKRQEPKSDVEIYAQVLREIQDEDDIRDEWGGISGDNPF